MPTVQAIACIEFVTDLCAVWQAAVIGPCVLGARHVDVLTAIDIDAHVQCHAPRARQGDREVGVIQALLALAQLIDVLGHRLVHGRPGHGEIPQKSIVVAAAAGQLFCRSRPRGLLRCQQAVVRARREQRAQIGKARTVAEVDWSFTCWHLRILFKEE